MKRLLITAVIIALGGCAAKTSPERHSIYYARHDPTMMAATMQAVQTQRQKQICLLISRYTNRGKTQKLRV